MGRWAWGLVLVLGCEGGMGVQPEAEVDAGVVGDPVAGFDVLLNAPYGGCGIPDGLVSRAGFAAVAAAAGWPATDARLPGRTPLNADLPYFLTRAEAPGDVTVLQANCLACHAAPFDGAVVLGLGNRLIDATGDRVPLLAALDGRVLEGPEQAAWAAWAGPARLLAPPTQVSTRGVTVGTLLALALGSRHPATLVVDDLRPGYLGGVLPRVPVAIPPLWRLRHRDTLGATGGLRGAQHRAAYLKTRICRDGPADIPELDAWFADVMAALRALEPPAWPYALDADLAAEGALVYAARCAGCHDGAERVVPVEEVGTDRALADLDEGLARSLGPWLAESPWGATTTLAATGGYVAPALDGVWITAPYLHNDAVPDLASLLDSRLRPVAWRGDPAVYDPARVGFAFEEVAPGGGPDTYDTTAPGYGAAGHTYGDDLSPEARRALIEHLKTL